MNAKLLLLLAAILALILVAGCGAQPQQEQSLEALYVAGAKEAPVNADPAGAANAVYELVKEDNQNYEAKLITTAEFEKITGITESEAIEVVAYYSNPKTGLCDLFIVKPYPSLRENVREKLIGYRETRMREFENFDILNAYSIAKNAVVYDQGEYLVMMMLSDNQAAQGQIDLYIPQ